MREIKLNLDDLDVESFTTVASVSGRGTVLGHARTYVEQTECCPTYAPYVCASAADECPTGGHAVTECSPECQPTDPIVCGTSVAIEL
jgi:hypothetical protein